MPKAVVTKATPLPLGIRESDLVYPKKEGWKAKAFTLYLSARFGWCVATLAISTGKRGYPGRTYGSSLTTGAIVTMGGGPHVLDTKTVYVTEARAPALAKLIEVYEKGVIDAGLIRDRIGSRRAQGQLMRAEGRTYWRWDS